MDVTQIRNSSASNKYKKPQIVESCFLYFIITAITCSLFCSTPLWIPFTSSFLSVSFPKITSLLLSHKSVFIIGNLIVFLLIGESKILYTECSDPVTNDDVYCDGKFSRGEKKEKIILEKKMDQSVKRKSCDCEEREEIEELVDELDGESEVSLPAEELNRRADDLIARVNREMRFEATLLSTI